MAAKRRKAAGGRRKSERLEFGLKWRVDRRKFEGEDVGAVVSRARKHFFDTGGEVLPGVQLEARWRNPDNRHPQHRAWKTARTPGEVRQFYRTLHGRRGALRAADLPAAESGVKVEPQTKVSRRMQAYWRKIRKLRKQHPKWDLARARREYRKGRN
jgi:hypothetical protein